MSIDSALGALQSITTTIGAGTSTITRTVLDIGGPTPAGAAAWTAQLRPASYRGVRFGVLSGSGKFGRRSVVHEYPMRDTVWVEDLGRATRHISVSGFLVGDDCIAQRDRMIAAAETRGAGALIHPTFGSLQVSLLDFAAEERWDQGRVFEITFVFVESGERIFPNIETSSGDAVSAACDGADLAASADFTLSTSSIMKGAAVASEAASTAAAWGRKAQNLANDATNLYHMVSTLKGSFGRYSSGAGINGIAAAAGALSSVTNTVPGLIAIGSVARNAVLSASNALTSTANGFGS